MSKKHHHLEIVRIKGNIIFWTRLIGKILNIDRKFSINNRKNTTLPDNTHHNLPTSTPPDFTNITIVQN